MATRAHDPRPKEVLAPNFDAEVDASSPDNERMAALYPEHVLSGCKTRLGHLGRWLRTESLGSLAGALNPKTQWRTDRARERERESEPEPCCSL